MVRLGASVIVTGAAFAIIILATHLLPSPVYGVLALSLSLVTLATSLAQSGLGTATVRALAAADSAPANYVRETVIRGIVGLALVGSLLLAAPIVLALQRAGDPLLSRSDLWWLTLGTFLFLVGRLSASSVNSVARGMHRLGVMELPNVTLSLAVVAGLGLFFPLHIHGIGAVGILLGISGAGTTALAAFLMKRLSGDVPRPLVPSLGAVIDLVNRALPYVLAGITTQVIAQFDILVLGLTRSPLDVAIYQPVVRLLDGIGTLVPTLLATIFLPVATRYYIHGRRDEFQDLYVSISKISFVLSTPVLLALACVPARLLTFLFGPDYKPPVAVVWVLVVAYVFTLGLGLNGVALLASGERRAIGVAFLLALLVMVVSSLILIPPYGPVGASVATLLSLVALNSLVSASLWRVSGIHPFRRDFLVCVFSVCVPFGIVLLLNASGFVTDVPRQAASVTLVWGAWLATLIVSGVLPRSDLRNLVAKIRRPARPEVREVNETASGPEPTPPPHIQ
jgi:O-antigen/teichoic acid export membrane protein